MSFAKSFGQVFFVYCYLCILFNKHSLLTSLESLFSLILEFAIFLFLSAISEK